jgi:hypothetical protein
MAKKKSRGRTRRTRRPKDGVVRKPQAYKPLKPIFDTLHAMSEHSHTQAMTGGPFDIPSTRLELAVFTRTINSLKSATQLLENGHWEFASPIVRHLYEIALNIEHLNAQPDRNAAVERYVRYGTLQRILNETAELEYRQTTRRAINPERLGRLRQLAGALAEFRGKDKNDGTPNWHTSWSGKSTRALAELSQHPMREPQYRLLFQGEWSEQTDGSPITFLDGVFRTVTPDWADEILDSDLIHIAQAAMLLQTLYIELWLMLDSIPNPDPDAALRWSETVAKTARSLNPDQWDMISQPATPPDSTEHEAEPQPEPDTPTVDEHAGTDRDEAAPPDT